MYSMCVQLFTAFEVAVLKLCYMYLGEWPKIEDGLHFLGTKSRGGRNMFVFFLHICGSAHLAAHSCCCGNVVTTATGITYRRVIVVARADEVDEVHAPYCND